jgi:hypothetical protein
MESWRDCISAREGEFALLMWRNILFEPAARWLSAALERAARSAFGGLPRR